MTFYIKFGHFWNLHTIYKLLWRKITIHWNMRVYNHSLIQRAIADLRIHQNGLDATLSIKRNRTTIYPNIYSPAGLTFDIKKVKPIFFVIRKKLYIWKQRVHWNKKKTETLRKIRGTFGYMFVFWKQTRFWKKKNRKKI